MFASILPISVTKVVNFQVPLQNSSLPFIAALLVCEASSSGSNIKQCANMHRKWVGGGQGPGFFLSKFQKLFINKCISICRMLLANFHCLGPVSSLLFEKKFCQASQITIPATLVAGAWVLVLFAKCKAFGKRLNLWDSASSSVSWE